MENVEGTLLRNNYIYIASVVSLSLFLSFIDACRRKEYSILEFISSSSLLPFEARNLFFSPVVKFLTGEGGMKASNMQLPEIVTLR